MENTCITTNKPDQKKKKLLHSEWKTERDKTLSKNHSFVKAKVWVVGNCSNTQQNICYWLKLYPMCCLKLQVFFMRVPLFRLVDYRRRLFPVSWMMIFFLNVLKSNTPFNSMCSRRFRSRKSNIGKLSVCPTYICHNQDMGTYLPLRQFCGWLPLDVSSRL